ncbi:hypothetical protein SAMN05518847_1011166 [Paenibacillus sp. OV219]|nr:hypothetical protein SAMN05518847_1011166 [Paenibacillus sp. OV219]
MKKIFAVTAMGICLASLVACSSLNTNTPASNSSSSPQTQQQTQKNGGPMKTQDGSVVGNGQAPNARSAPAQGGASGTVDSVSTSGFTMTTSTGLQVTVNETSSTTYMKGTSSTSANAIAKGDFVLALGTANGPTIEASQVILTPPGGQSATASEVIPFVKKQGQGNGQDQDQATTTKSVGQIPADYSEGSGTIVSGIEADKVTEAVLYAYPGGVVNRVAKMSDGEYNVHIMGVSWPHHVFVSADFKVVGAN